MGLRQDRLGDQIRDILAMQFSTGNIRDPRVQGVTITAVKLTADLQVAKVFFRVFEPEKLKDASVGLGKAAGFLRNILSERLDVRRSPELRFVYDKSIDEGANIEGILSKLRDESSGE